MIIASESSPRFEGQPVTGGQWAQPSYPQTSTNNQPIYIQVQPEQPQPSRNDQVNPNYEPVINNPILESPQTTQQPKSTKQKRNV